MQNLGKAIGVREHLNAKSQKEVGIREHLNAKSQIGGQHKISEGGTKSHDDGESGEMELS